MKRVVAIVAVVVMMGSLGFGSVASAASEQAAKLTGKVVETMDSGGYTYVCLEKAKKKTWVAVPQMKVEKGKTMTFEPGMEMTDFKSKTMNRTFDKIYFSSGVAK